MRAIGCLTVIALIVAGVVWWCSGNDATGQDRAQWAGEKAHRGWNKFADFVKNAKDGWKKVPDDANKQSGGGSPTPTPTGQPRTVLP